MKPDTQNNLFLSFKCALEGLRYAFQTQRNFRFHLFVCILVMLAAWWLEVPPAALSVLILTIGFVLVVELLNTSVEVMVDLVSPDYHPLAKTVKDLAAGAVLLVAIASILVGIVILGPPLWERLIQ